MNSPVAAVHRLDRAGPVVGVDLGGTKIAAAVVNEDGVPGPVVTVPTRAAEGPDAVLDAVAEAVGQATAQVRVHGTGTGLAGIGVGTAGAIDSGTGVVVSSTDTFPGWVGTNIADGLRDRLGPIGASVLNDVDAHVLGESWRGAAIGVGSLLMVAAGTGIGGALMVDGRLVVGRHHLAGEIGHMPAVGADGLRCPCGRLGHLEALAAGPAILRRYHALGGDPEVGDTRAVVARAAAGDGTATRSVTEAAAGLGRTVAGLVTTLDPDLVVVGGGLAQAGPLWWDAFESTLRAELVEALADVGVVPAALGPVAAIIGAARPLFELI
ncbi:ROK family protein [Ammonicoccus fulvus]|uniref:ROK family protein n=1 Tax=Ammonicoccus fulvus TaxID=3138240 RepID=A0ABZ3FLY5_9ACTN